MFRTLIIEKNNNYGEHFGCLFLLHPLLGKKCVKINAKAFYEKCAGVYGKAPAHCDKIILDCWL